MHARSGTGSKAYIVKACEKGVRISHLSKHIFDLYQRVFISYLAIIIILALNCWNLTLVQLFSVVNSRGKNLLSPNSLWHHTQLGHVLPGVRTHNIVPLGEKQVLWEGCVSNFMNIQAVKY